MNKVLFIVILLIVISSTGFAYSPDTSNWNVKNVKDVDFKIPPQYENGKLKDNSYMLTNAYTFRILSLDYYNNLKFNYGSDITSDDVLNYEKTTIEGHPAYVIYSYVDVAQKNVVSIYLPINNTIFVISYEGDSITPEITEMIKDTSQPSMSDDVFYQKLSHALDDYKSDLVKEEMEYEMSQSYSRGYRDGHANGNRYYFFYNPF